MFSAFMNALRLPDLRNKLLITGLILLVYQFAAHVPVVGVNRFALEQLMNPNNAGAGLIQVLTLLSGGAVANFSVIANGVYPYITASIIFQLLVPIVPSLEAIQRYTYFATIPMALLQAFGQIQIFNSLLGTQEIIPGFGVEFLLTISVLTSMTAGTMFAVWLGELITEQGIGNGISIIIFAGIVARAPVNLADMGQNSPLPLYSLFLFVLITAASILVIAHIQEAVRRIPVQYGKRVRGRKQYGGASTHIPLKVNPVGMIPLIFSQAIITLPAVIVNFFPPGEFSQSITNTFGTQQGFVYWFSFFLLTVGFTFFYSDVMIANQNLADNLQRQGGFIPGIRPGKNTESYIVTVTRRITLVGALFLGIIAVTPGLVGALNDLLFQGQFTGTAGNPALVLSGSGLIIVVGVVIDTMRQLEAQLVMRNYEGFMR
jgi:preprotein translocase subunit SecY